MPKRHDLEPIAKGFTTESQRTQRGQDLWMLSLSLCALCLCGAYCFGRYLPFLVFCLNRAQLLLA